MRAEPVRARVLPHVRRLHAHGEAVLGERVLDPEIERERVARRRVQPVLEHGPVGLLLGDRPLRPAHEPVDRVAALGLVERELVALARELVAAVLDPVRPRREQLPAAGAAHRDDAVAVEHRLVADGVAAQAAADADDDHSLVADRELDLLARRADRFLHSRNVRRRAASWLHPHRTMLLRQHFPSVGSHEPARVDGRRSRPDPVRDDLALPLPVRAADAWARAARRDHADALAPVGRRGLAPADALLRDAAPDQLRDRGRDRARPGVRVRDELVGVLEVRRQRLRRAARDRGPRGVHARVDVPRPLDLRLEPALAARPSGDDLDRRARQLAVGLLHPRRQLVDAAPGRLQDRERRGAADERLGAALEQLRAAGVSCTRCSPG